MAYRILLVLCILAGTKALAQSDTATVIQDSTAAPKDSLSKFDRFNQKAEALFKENCMACHGSNFEGDFGPNLTKAGSRLSKDQIVTQIIKGGSQMPGFEKSLDTTAIETLATWLAAKK